METEYGKLFFHFVSIKNLKQLLNCIYLLKFCFQVNDCSLICQLKEMFLFSFFVFLLKNNWFSMSYHAYLFNFNRALVMYYYSEYLTSYYLKKKFNLSFMFKFMCWNCLYEKSQKLNLIINYSKTLFIQLTNYSQHYLKYSKNSAYLTIAYLHIYLNSFVNSKVVINFCSSDHIHVSIYFKLECLLAYFLIIISIQLFLLFILKRMGWDSCIYCYCYFSQGYLNGCFLCFCLHLLTQINDEHFLYYLYFNYCTFVQVFVLLIIAITIIKQKKLSRLLIVLDYSLSCIFI